MDTDIFCSEGSGAGSGFAEACPRGYAEWSKIGMTQNKENALNDLRLEDMNQDELIEAVGEALLQAAQETPENQPEVTQEEQPRFQLAELFCHVLEKIHWIILSALICGLVAGAVTWRTLEPVYEATAKLYIQKSAGVQLSLADVQVASNLTNDYREVFRTWEIHEMVRNALGLDYSNAQMQRMVSATNPSDTRLLYITARHENPNMAMKLANAYATATKQFLTQVIFREEPLTFSIARLPSTPAGLTRTHCILLGLAIGAAAMLIVVMLVFLVDDRPRTTDDIVRAASIPTLAVVPRDNRKVKRNESRKPVSARK